MGTPQTHAIELLELMLNPLPNWIIATGQKPGVVRVQTLHPDPSSTHSTGGTWPEVSIRYLSITGVSIAIMDCRQDIQPDLGLRAIHAALGLDRPDSAIQLRVDEPVHGRHWRAVGEKRRIANHRRLTSSVTRSDPILATRSPSQTRTRVVLVLGRRNLVHQLRTPEAIQASSDSSQANRSKEEWQEPSERRRHTSIKEVVSDVIRQR
jgi:hypothetical protein